MPNYVETTPAVFTRISGVSDRQANEQAVLMGRRFLGVELKESYYRWAGRHLAEAQQMTKQQTVFTEAA